MKSIRWARRAEWLLRVVSGEQCGLLATGIRGTLRSLALLYGLGLELNLALYRWGWLQATRLPCRVISVGNLTLGGTGKTSCVLWLARKLLRAGKRVAILSRGPSRRGRESVAVVSDGQRISLNVAEAGDEPFLLAQMLPEVPVLVGKHRTLTGRYAVERLGSEVLLLDDGFQYWRLYKDWDIALVDATAPFGVGKLFPAGTLREPPAHLSRANMVWFTRSEGLSSAERVALEAEVRRWYPTGPVVWLAQRPLYVRPLGGEEQYPPTWLRGKRVGALSSIGNPWAFEQTVEGLGVAALEPVRFLDHHFYRPEEIAFITEQSQQAGMELILTTEKDATRLSAEWPTALPIWVLGVEVEVLGGDTAALAKLWE